MLGAFKSGPSDAVVVAAMSGKGNAWLGDCHLTLSADCRGKTFRGPGGHKVAYRGCVRPRR